MPARLASSYQHVQNMAAICGRKGEVQSVLQHPDVQQSFLEYYRQQHQQEQTAHLLKL